MTALQKGRRNALYLFGIIFITTLPALADGISATATYSVGLNAATPALYDYSLTLNNTGTTTVGTFWFGWVPGGDFLNPLPTSVLAPAGWTDGLFTNASDTGNSIRWVTTASLLQPGQSLSGFSFESTETPNQLLGQVPSGVGAGDPILTSFVYPNAPLADPGDQFVATAVTPEPASLLLLATGLLAGTGGVYRRIRHTQAT